MRNSPDELCSSGLCYPKVCTLYVHHFRAVFRHHSSSVSDRSAHTGAAALHGASPFVPHPSFCVKCTIVKCKCMYLPSAEVRLRSLCRCSGSEWSVSLATSASTSNKDWGDRSPEPAKLHTRNSD